MCIPRADRAVNRDVTDFVRVGMESLQVTYNFLGLCDPWAAHIILGSAFEILTATKVMPPRLMVVYAEQVVNHHLLATSSHPAYCSNVGHDWLASQIKR
jgi:hypothetical protein